MKHGDIMFLEGALQWTDPDKQFASDVECSLDFDCNSFAFIQRSHRSHKGLNVIDKSSSVWWNDWEMGSLVASKPCQRVLYCTGNQRDHLFKYGANASMNATTVKFSSYRTVRTRYTSCNLWVEWLGSCCTICWTCISAIEHEFPLLPFLVRGSFAAPSEQRLRLTMLIHVPRMKSLQHQQQETNAKTT